MHLFVLLFAAVATVNAGVVMSKDALKSSVRALHVRSIPAVLGYSSNVYEIHMQPYSFNVRPLVAGVNLVDESKSVQGELMFTQIHPPSGPVLITGNITGLAKGHHGLHIHEFGDMKKGCASAGPHFNPYMQQHGGPIDPFRHVGDLGNILVGDDGVARVEIWDQMISLTGSHSILGRSVVVHEMKDDYGRGGDVESITTGNAGARLACGVVGYTFQESMMFPPHLPPWATGAPWDPLGPPMMGGPPSGPPSGPPAENPQAEAAPESGAQMAPDAGASEQAPDAGGEPAPVPDA